MLSPSFDKGHDVVTLTKEVFELFWLSLGTLKLDVYMGFVSLFNNDCSKSSRPEKNSSMSPSFGLIRTLFK
jgi:hypothetical protein